MKRKFFIILTLLVTAVLFAGCNDPAPTATIEPEGTEKIITEQVLTEKVITEEITWDNWAFNFSSSIMATRCGKLYF